jgi:hypothetical protein
VLIRSSRLAFIPVGQGRTSGWAPRRSLPAPIERAKNFSICLNSTQQKDQPPMTTLTTPDEEAERLAMIAALTALKNKPDRLTALVGSPGARKQHVRQQMRISPVEQAGLKLIQHVLSFHVGRGVAYSLIFRLALDALAAECRRSLKDPAVAARLKAQLMLVRAEKKAENANA